MATFWVIGFILLAGYVILGYIKPAIALLTIPLTVVALIYFDAYGSEDGVYIMMALLLFVVTMAAVAISERRADERRWYHRVARLALACIVAFLVALVALAVFNEFGGVVFVPTLFLMAIVALILTLVRYGKTTRQMAAMMVFSTIGASIRQNLPLPMALDCAATGRHDLAARLLQRIKIWLIKGYPLSEAIRRGYPRCPPWALAMLTAGERISQAPVAAAVVEKEMRARAVERTRLRPVPPVYPLIILGIAFVFTMFLMKFVIPQYSSVLKEMTEGKLPAPTRALMAVMHFIVYDPGPWVQLAIILAIIVAYLVFRTSRRRRPDKPYLHTWIIDSIRWFSPIVRWFERNRALSQVVELLRMSLNAGCPVNEAIRGTLGLDVNVFFRRRLACWLGSVERGDDIGDSARRCGLGHPLAWAFSSPNAGNTPAILETLESYYRSNYSYRVNLARFIFWPLCVIGLGLIVGFIVVAMFLPCVTVVTEMSATVYP